MRPFGEDSFGFAFLLHCVSWTVRSCVPVFLKVWKVSRYCIGMPLCSLLLCVFFLLYYYYHPL